MSKRKLSAEDCSNRPHKRRSTVKMWGWFWGNKEDTSTSQGKLKFRCSGDGSQHHLAEEFIKELREKIPSLTEVSEEEEEEEDVLLVFCQNGTKWNSSETKPSVLVVFHDQYPAGTEPDSSSSSQGKRILTVDCWSREEQQIKRPDLDTVSEWIKHQMVPDSPTEQPAAQPGGVRFLRCVSGNTLGSDDGFIRKLREGIPSLREENNVEKCNFILAFCPVVSRAGTDIEAALKKLQHLSESKPAVLVVLHHTFDQEVSVADSSRSVNRGNTLTVDCLFHEDRGLLQCYRNQQALEKVAQQIKPPENLGILQRFIPFSSFWNILPSGISCPTGPNPNEEKSEQIVANAAAAEPTTREKKERDQLKAELTKQLQEKDKLLQEIWKTLSSILHNTNQNHLENEQRANLIKHLREIEQKLKETSETFSSSTPPNMNEDPPSLSDNDPTEDFYFL